MHSLFHNRYTKRADGDVAMDEATRSLAFFNAVRGSPPAVISATLKSVLNAWCTAGNFGATVGPCVFCQTVGCDTLDHFAVCAQLCRVAGQCLHASLPEVDRHLVPVHGTSYVSACHMYFSLLCYNRCRTGTAKFTRGMYESFLLRQLGVDKKLRLAIS